MQEFISEDDLQIFEGWLGYQGVDAATTTPEELMICRRLFEQTWPRPTLLVNLLRGSSSPGFFTAISYRNYFL
jgi:hypothetical protein